VRSLHRTLTVSSRFLAVVSSPPTPRRHHAISAKNRPIYCGFFFKLWDALFGTQYEGACACCECRPKRSVQEWEAIEKPDYSVLLSAGWWLTSSAAVSK
jgi:hypothetical protein